MTDDTHFLVSKETMSSRNYVHVQLIYNSNSTFSANAEGHERFMRQREMEKVGRLMHLTRRCLYNPMPQVSIAFSDRP